jgi:arsenate reductase (thioredoxin)
MAHGFLQSFDNRLQVFSAGTEPAVKINSTAVKVMKEAGVDISQNIPTNVSQYLSEDWDYVITVCDNANETCPVFPGKVRHRLHLGFEDPSKTRGSYIEIMASFYDIRNEIRDEFYKLYESELRNKI